MNCSTIFFILLFFVFLVACSEDKTFEKRYDTTERGLSEFLNENDKDVWGYQIFEKILNNLDKVSELEKSEIVYIIFNNERGVLSVHWIGRNLIIEGVRVSQEGAPARFVELEISEYDMKFLEAQNNEKLYGAAIFEVDPADLEILSSWVLSGNGGLEVVLYRDGKTISDPYRDIEIVSEDTKNTSVLDS